MCVECRYYDVTELGDPESFSAAMAALPWSARRESVLRFRRGEDRRLCLGAGILAAHMLREAGAADLTLSRDENGKPFLLRYPSIHFNLSHSGTMAVCAVADRPVGVDTEKKGIDPGEIGEICFRPREREWISASPDPEEAFIRLWTRKESYLKLTGTGLAVAPDTFSVLPGEAPEDGIAWKEERVGVYLICVCTRGERKVIFRPWRYVAEFT